MIEQVQIVLHIKMFSQEIKRKRENIKLKEYKAAILQTYNSHTCKTIWQVTFIKFTI